MNFLPVLAFDRDLIGIVIAVIWVLGIVVRVIKGGKEDAAAPPARRDRPEQLRTEIEEFLDEIAGNAQRKPNRQVPQQRPPERTRPPTKTQANKKQSPKQKQTTKSTVKPTAASKPVKLAEQHLQTSNLGGELRSHLATYMQADRVGQEVQRDMQNRIAAEVEADLGRSFATQAPSAPMSVHPLVKLLRDPQGARTAIAIQEILQRPRSLR